MEKQGARVERGQANLVVPTGESELMYVHPAVGPSTYQEVGRQIISQNQSVPTGDLTAPLIYMAYCDETVKNEPKFSGVRDLIKNRYLWVFNRNIWTTEGVYVVQDEDAEWRNASFNIEELEDLLSDGDTEFGVKFSQDRKIRFAPKNTYSLGEQSPESLARDGFVIANYDVKGAEKLREVSSRMRSGPKTYGLKIEEGQNPEQRVASLDSYWNFGDSRLCVDGNYWDDYGFGFAFGVVPHKRE